MFALLARPGYALLFATVVSAVGGVAIGLRLGKLVVSRHWPSDELSVIRRRHRFASTGLGILAAATAGMSIPAHGRMWILFLAPVIALCAFWAEQYGEGAAHRIW